jgi:hypothetical protein
MDTYSVWVVMRPSSSVTISSMYAVPAYIVSLGAPLVDSQCDTSATLGVRLG